MKTMSLDFKPLPTLEVPLEYLGFYNQLTQEFYLKGKEPYNLLLSAALVEFYLNTAKDGYKAYGYPDKEAFIQGLLELGRTQKLKLFAQLTTTRSFRRKAALYKAQKQVSAYEAVKSLVSKKINNRNNNWRKITKAEYTFIEDFLLEHPLAGSKRIYTALRKNFGAVSITPAAVNYQRKKVIRNFDNLIASKKFR